MIRLVSVLFLYQSLKPDLSGRYKKTLSFDAYLRLLTSQICHVEVRDVDILRLLQARDERRDPTVGAILVDGDVVSTLVGRHVRVAILDHQDIFQFCVVGQAGHSGGGVRASWKPVPEELVWLGVDCCEVLVHTVDESEERRGSTLITPVTVHPVT